MLQKLFKFHPGLVGAVAGFSSGALFSTLWIGLESAGAGLNETESAWLAVVTVVVLYCLPLLMGYFAYYSYAGLQTDSTKSASQSWKTIAVIVFPLGFAYFLSLVVIFTPPESISSATMQSIFIGYAAIALALLYLFYKLPWVDLGRRLMRDFSAAADEGYQECVAAEAKIMDARMQSEQQQNSINKVEDR